MKSFKEYTGIKTPPASLEESLNPGGVSVKMGSTQYNLEVADTPDKIIEGLSYRENIPQKTGMLFVMPKEQIHEFWMKDCLTDMDIIFLTTEGQIVNMENMIKERHKVSFETNESYQSRLKMYSSKYPAKYAIEIPSGDISRLGLEVGQYININNEITEQYPSTVDRPQIPGSSWYTSTGRTQRAAPATPKSGKNIGISQRGSTKGQRRLFPVAPRPGEDGYDPKWYDTLGTASRDIENEFTRDRATLARLILPTPEDVRERPIETAAAYGTFDRGFRGVTRTGPGVTRSLGLRVPVVSRLGRNRTMIGKAWPIAAGVLAGDLVRDIVTEPALDALDPLIDKSVQDKMDSDFEERKKEPWYQEVLKSKARRDKIDSDRAELIKSDLDSHRPQFP